jgi:signal transduction histidine kinase
LRPSILDDLGLAEALARHAEDFEQTHGIATAVDYPDGPLGRLPEAVETALYRIAQEALTNVAKHARAKHVDIAVGRGPRRVRLRVSDDGRGFDPAAGGQFGLSGMAERADLLGGRLTVESAPGGGTMLTADIPLTETPHGEDSGAGRG